MRRAALHFRQLNGSAVEAANAFWSEFLNDSYVLSPDAAGSFEEVLELVNMAKLVMQETCVVLWPDEDIHTSIFALSDRLMQGPTYIDQHHQSATRE